MPLTSMTIAQDLETLNDAPDDIQDDVICPPGDLYSDEPTLETYLHLQQMMLLIKCLDWLWRDRNDYFAAGNLTVYYSARRLKSEKYRGPDFFVVLDTERKPRKSWVVWEEDGQYPNVIIEILSDSTSRTDKGIKKKIYQNAFRTPDYFWFDPNNLEFAGFHLLDNKYQPLDANSQGWLWSEQLSLYLGVHQDKLRFFTPEGSLVPTPEEFAEQETQRAEQEKEKSDRMAAKLRELGIDPNNI